MSNIEIKATAFDKIVKIIQETDSYWDCDVRLAYGEIETIINVATADLQSEDA